jgi:hypothetical protein
MSRRFLPARLVASTFVLATTCGVIACATPIDRGGEEGDDIEGQLIGGVPIHAKALDAVGALVIVSSDYEPDAGAWDSDPWPYDAEPGGGWSETGPDGGGFGETGPIDETGGGYGETGPIDETGGGSGETGGSPDGGWFSGARKPAGTKLNSRYTQFCTATLIGAKTIVTAKHCIQGMESFKVAFVTGPDAANPRAVYDVVARIPETSITGGANGIGADIGVMRLDRPVEGIAPIEYGTLARSDLNKTFAAVGYGVMGRGLGSGKRNGGEITLAALEGSAPQIAFKSEDDYLEAYAKAYGATLDQARQSPEFVDHVSTIWRTELLPSHEAYFRVGPTQAQPCHGDSGGPILRKDAKGKLRIFGVLARGIVTDGVDNCSAGAIYTTFGPKVRTFVTNSLACDKIPAQGACEGTTAIRCTRPGEGPERVVKTNCASLGLVCSATETGDVGCVDE